MEQKDLEKQFESLHEILLGILILYSANIPSEKYKIKSKPFSVYRKEVLRLLFGRLCVILFDDSKNKKYNTISYKILIKNIQESKQDESLMDLLNDINDAEKKYKKYRDKIFAHVELNRDYSLVKLDEDLIVKYVADMINLAEKVDDAVFLLYRKASIDRLKSERDKLSNKIWSAYENGGLVEKIET